MILLLGLCGLTATSTRTEDEQEDADSFDEEDDVDRMDDDDNDGMFALQQIPSQRGFANMQQE